MRRGGWYTVAAALLAAMVALAAGMVLGEEGRAGARAGAATGFAVQVAAFWLLSVWALPGRPVLAHGMAMLLRMLVLGVAALLWVPRSGLPAAPTLLSLVAVFFLTMLVEPIALRIGAPRRAGPAGAAGQ